jgi:hypothetical protein
MRYMCVQVLWSGGKIEWIWLPWGKKSLDDIRNRGGAILGYHE